MNPEKKNRERLSLRLRENCPEHQRLLRSCKNRDRKKYRSMTDYVAAAVKALENERYVNLQLNIDTLSKEELDAVYFLLEHAGK